MDRIPSKAFEPISIGKLTLPNRFVRSATHEGLADDNGFATDQLIAKLVELARGEVGLILSGHAFVRADGKAGRRQLAADREECLPSLQKIARAVHDAGGRIFLQIAHAGGMAAHRATAVGPSAFSPGGGKEACAALEEAEIFELTAAFGHAARRAQQAGFDGVQIHAAHGYLLSEFLSSYYNQREDIYGGSIEHRARFLYEVLAMVRGQVGEDFPVIVKINAEDFVPGGFSAGECVLVCDELAKRGIDGIEISGGIPAAEPKLSPIRPVDLPESSPVYYEEQARKVKKNLHIPVILVGGIRHLQRAEELLASDACDLTALARPLIREPDLVRRWGFGNRDRATCISCNQCMRQIVTGHGLCCPVALKNQQATSKEQA